MKKYTFIILLVVLIFSCNNTNYFYPDGNVKITDYTSYVDSSTGNKVYNINYLIINNGTREITKTIFSYKATSDKEIYTSTETIEISIQPTKSIYNSFNFVLFDNSEVISTIDNITIESQYYY